MLNNLRENCGLLTIFLNLLPRLSCLCTVTSFWNTTCIFFIITSLRFHRILATCDNQQSKFKVQLTIRTQINVGDSSHSSSPSAAFHHTHAPVRIAFRSGIARQAERRLNGLHVERASSKWSSMNITWEPVSILDLLEHSSQGLWASSRVYVCACGGPGGLSPQKRHG